MTLTADARAINHSAAAAGRMCPFDYRYDPIVFARAPEITTDILYVVGGLYGNLASLDAIERLAEAETAPVTIVFNGDFHWFDAEPGWFSEIAHRVAAHHAIRGNVETEIARQNDIGAGCGCAYPGTVDDGAVTRSNEILSNLKRIGIGIRGTRERLDRLPQHMIARVGNLRIAIVHGDAASLAGWRFAHDALDNPANWQWFADVQHAAKVDVFASTHTCLAALRDLSINGRLTIVNNGAAGMPNFSGSRLGLITRIAAMPSPNPRLYGIVRADVHIDAIAVAYDTEAFLKRFLGRWREGSAAHASYFQRIVNGPDYSVAQAAPHSHKIAKEPTI
jgi:hypothetical protein